jgi:DNA-binding LacI/PurR family transcriptional regulator
MRDKILARVSDAGYTPNPLYQAMRQKDNKQIAIMLPNLLRLAGASEISAGVDRLCERMMAYGFKFYYIGRTQVSLKTYGLPMWKVAMAVVVDTNNAEMIEELDSSGIPYVSLNGETGPNGTAITTDDYANMKMAMEYLTGLGHSHICYINFYRRDKTSGAIMEDQHPSIATRLKAYEDSCAKTGFKPCEESLRRDIDVNATINAGLNANCTAFVAYNFPLAMETSAILHPRLTRP